MRSKEGIAEIHMARLCIRVLWGRLAHVPEFLFRTLPHGRVAWRAARGRRRHTTAMIRLKLRDHSYRPTEKAFPDRDSHTHSAAGFAFDIERV
jgi:hypothetical protein